MRIQRTANAGVLLKLDGLTFLLDGICGEISPYLATPKEVRHTLYAELPDVVAFTHAHTDHYDAEFSSHYESAAKRRVLLPETAGECHAGNVKIQWTETRHIGRNDLPHVSYVLTGSRCVWFMGDASPNTLKNMASFQTPDVLFVPFAYLNTKSALEATKRVGATDIVLLHMPNREADVYRVWETVQDTIANEQNIHILEMGETLDLLD